MNLIKGSGRTTGSEVLDSPKVTEADLDGQLVTLIYSKLVRELGERGRRYQVAALVLS
jgi:hypothetical protein